MKWFKVLSDGKLAFPFIKKAKAGNTTICLVGFDDQIFALSAKCPHAGADISQGWCKDGRLICPFHRYGYDLHTGKGHPGQGDFIKTYAVEQRDDGVYVGIASPWAWLFG